MLPLCLAATEANSMTESSNVKPRQHCLEPKLASWNLLWTGRPTPDAYSASGNDAHCPRLLYG